MDLARSAVASFTGARIETSSAWFSSPIASSRVLHGRADRNSNYWSVAHKWPWSRPSRARGSKQCNTDGITYHCPVASFTGARIETIRMGTGDAYGLSRPSRARGSKHTTDKTQDIDGLSRPSRARGSKQGTTRYYVSKSGVASFTGARIETTEPPSCCSARPVASFTGARIETDQNRFRPGALSVASFTGARIET